MANTSVEYKNVDADKTEKEVDDVSSGYMHISKINSTVASNIEDESLSLHNSAGEENISSQKTYELKGTYVIKETLKHDTDQYSGTEICPVCAQTSRTIKEATHFCYNCDRRGRYLCKTCIKHHDLWSGKGHVIVSLSVDRETNSDWQQQQWQIQPEHGHPEYQYIDRNSDWQQQRWQIQLEHGNPEYQYVDSWIQNTTADDACKYEKPTEQEMALVITDKTNESHQARANTKTDVPPRPRRPPPDTVPKTINNSNQDTYEIYNRANNNTFVPPRPRMPLPDTVPKTIQISDEETYENYETVKGMTRIKSRTRGTRIDDNWGLVSNRGNTRANNKTHVPLRSRRPSPDTIPKTIHNSDEDTYEFNNRANTNKFVPQRSRMPLPDTVPKTIHNSDEEVYEECDSESDVIHRPRLPLPNDHQRHFDENLYEDYETVTRATRIERRTRIDDNLGLASNRTPLIDGTGQPFNGYDNAESDYDMVGLYSRYGTRNKVKHNPLRSKDKYCMIM